MYKEKKSNVILAFKNGVTLTPECRGSLHTPTTVETMEFLGYLYKEMAVEARVLEIRLNYANEFCWLSEET